MPPSHPRPEDLTALGAALSLLAQDLTQAGEDLLGQLVVLGDRGAQGAVDGMVDDAVDALRELAVTAREASLSLADATP